MRARFERARNEKFQPLLPRISCEVESMYLVPVEVPVPPLLVGVVQPSIHPVVAQVQASIWPHCTGPQHEMHVQVLKNTSGFKHCFITSNELCIFLL
jgi:hypothetical protein